MLEFFTFLIFFLFFATPYVWLHFFLIQFKRAWYERSSYEKFLTIYSIITLTLVLIREYWILSLFGLGHWTAYLIVIPLLFITLLWVFYVKSQFKLNWKKGDLFHRVNTIFMIILVAYTLQTFALLYWFFLNHFFG